jgi:CheY-like chemotaxis protein
MMGDDDIGEGRWASGAGVDLVPGLVVEFVRMVVVDEGAGGAELVGWLRGRGYECVLEGSIEGAMAGLREGVLPDCLVLRFERERAALVADLVRLVRSRGEGCRVLVVGDGVDDEELVEGWVKLGVDDFLPDPVLGGSLAAVRLLVAERAVLRWRERERAWGETRAFRGRFEEVFRRGPVAALVVTEREGLVLDANWGAEALLEYPGGGLRQQFLSLAMPGLFDREDFPGIWGEASRVLRGVIQPRADGGERVLEVMVTRVSWGAEAALLLNLREEGVTEVAVERPRGRRILVMEDEPLVREVFSRMLGAHGYAVTCTADGAAAVAAWREAARREEPFDLIVADLEIRGGEGGVAVMARLREEFPGLRAVLTTGYTEDAALAEHAARGYSAVLAKPFSMESLLEAVASVLEC